MSPFNPLNRATHGDDHTFGESGCKLALQNLTEQLSALPIRRYRVELQALSPIQFRHHPGIDWQHALAEVLKTKGNQHAQHCSLCQPNAPCAYHLLFNPKRPASYVRQRPSRQVPLPYLLQPSALATRQYQPEQTLQLEFSLIGEAAIAHASTLREAIGLIGQRGIGRNGGQFELLSHRLLSTHEHSAAEPKPHSAPNQRLSIHYQTPLQLRTGNQLLTPNSFDSGFFLQQLFKRLSSLSYFYGKRGEKLPLSDIEPYLQPLPVAEAQLRWSDNINRYPASTHEQHHQGLIGHIALNSARLASLKPALDLAQWLNLGENAHLGLGQFRLDWQTH